MKAGVAAGVQTAVVYALCC